MSQNRTIAFHTLGCKLNFAETSSIGRTLSEAGYQKADFDSGADVVLINTCSVTENADRECRSIVNRAMALNSESIIIVIGCFAQLKPESVASIPGVDLVLGAGEKFKVEEYLSQLTSKGPALIHSCEIGEVNTFTSSWSAGDRTRVFLKVQDGCDYSCTFCTIPMARGASRSQWPEQVLQNVQEIVTGGAKEIVLTGINLGDYGIIDTASGKRESSFGELVEMLDELHAPVRFRISSIEPNLLHDDIIRRVARSDSFMPHFHIPLQSGSDEVLKRMRRRYLTALYADRVETIRQQMPHACIGVDVITGFPGETEEHFKDTQRFLADLDISYLHVFTYSERDNTPAADFEGSVPPALRKDRTRMLRALSLRKQRAFYESQLGSVRTVLFEADQKKGFMHGYTDNYVKVKVPYDPSLINSLRECRLEMVDADGDVMVTILEPVTA